MLGLATDVIKHVAWYVSHRIDPRPRERASDPLSIRRGQLPLDAGPQSGLRLAGAPALVELDVLDGRYRLDFAGGGGEKRLGGRAQVIHGARTLRDRHLVHHTSPRDGRKDVLAQRGVQTVPPGSTQKSDEVGASSTRPWG